MELLPSILVALLFSAIAICALPPDDSSDYEFDEDSDANATVTPQASTEIMEADKVNPETSPFPDIEILNTTFPDQELSETIDPSDAEVTEDPSFSDNVEITEDPSFLNSEILESPSFSDFNSGSVEVQVARVLGMGYNLFRANPFSTTQDPGLVNISHYVIPACRSKKEQCVKIFSSPTTTEVKYVSTFVDFQKAVRSISQDLGELTVDLERAASLENVNTSLFQDAFFTESVTITSSFEATLGDHKKTDFPLKPELIQALCELPEDYNRDAYIRLLEKFGTHIVVNARFGAISINGTFIPADMINTALQQSGHQIVEMDKSGTFKDLSIRTAELDSAKHISLSSSGEVPIVMKLRKISFYVTAIRLGSAPDCQKILTTEKRVSRSETEYYQKIQKNLDDALNKYADDVIDLSEERKIPAEPTESAAGTTTSDDGDEETLPTMTTITPWTPPVILTTTTLTTSTIATITTTPTTQTLPANLPAVTAATTTLTTAITKTSPETTMLETSSMPTTLTFPKTTTMLTAATTFITKVTKSTTPKKPGTHIRSTMRKRPTRSTTQRKPRSTTTRKTRPRPYTRVPVQFPSQKTTDKVTSTTPVLLTSDITTTKGFKNPDITTSTSNHLKTTCNGANLYLGYGYDIFRADPHGTQADPGFHTTAPVVIRKECQNDFTCSEDITCWRGTGMDIRKTVFHVTKRNDYIIHELDQSLTILDNVLRSVILQRSASSPSLKKVKQLLSAGVTFTDTVSVNGSAKAELLHRQVPSLHSGLLHALCDLPATYVESQFISFLREFGTHIVVKVRMGNVTVHRTEHPRSTATQPFSQGNLGTGRNAIPPESSISQKSTADQTYQIVTKSNSPVVLTLRELGYFMTKSRIQKSGVALPSCQRLLNQNGAIQELQGFLTRALVDYAAEVRNLYDNDGLVTTLPPKTSHTITEFLPTNTLTTTPLRTTALKPGFKTTMPIVRATKSTQTPGRRRMATSTAVSWPNLFPTNQFPEVRVPLFLEWPSGTYALLEGSTGCPLAAEFWPVSGQYLKSAEDIGNFARWQEDFPSKTSSIFTTDGIHMNFCVKHIQFGFNPKWPRGSYCLFKSGDCPRGFSRSYVQHGSTNRHWNTDLDMLRVEWNPLDSQFEFCCRSDGRPDMPITLPTQRPFFLLRAGEECQHVRDMKMTPVWLSTICETTPNGCRIFSADDARPGFTVEGRNWTWHFCHYQPEHAGFL